MKLFDVYRWSQADRTATWIACVRANHEPHARRIAGHRFGAESVDMSQRYVIRPKGETWGMPCRVIGRSESSRARKGAAS